MSMSGGGNPFCACFRLISERCHLRQRQSQSKCQRLPKNEVQVEGVGPNSQDVASQSAVLIFLRLGHMLLTAAELIGLPVRPSPVPVGFSTGQQQFVGGRFGHGHQVARAGWMGGGWWVLR